MRKEVIYAIIAGVSIGLVAAFGVWRISKLVSHKRTTINIRKDTPTPKNNLGIALDELKDYDVVSESTYVVKGFTDVNSDIIISTLDNDYHIKSDTQGEFEEQIDVPKGISQVKLTSLNSLENTSETKIYLTNDSDLEKGSTSYVGTITDISSKTIQLKGAQSGILQISTDDETKFVNSLKKNALVKESDLAIGDYIIAMGTINGNKVLKTKKILITSPLSENKIEVIKGVVESISKTKLILNKSNGEIEEFTLPKKWTGPNYSDLDKGQVIFLTGIRDDKKSYTLRTIFTTVE